MSDTGAAAWQWTQMLPLTRWSPPPAEALRQHSVLPGSGCSRCPYWRVQKFFLLPDCAALHWRCCSGECCAVTLSETICVCSSLLLFVCGSAALSYYILLLLFFLMLFTKHTFFPVYNGFLSFTVAPELSSGYVFLTLVKGIWFCFHVQSQPLKTFENVTVMKINLTTQESSIEILNPTVYTTQTKGVGRPLEKSPPGKIQPTIGRCTSQ